MSLVGSSSSAYSSQKETNITDTQNIGGAQSNLSGANLNAGTGDMTIVNTSVPNEAFALIGNAIDALSSVSSSANTNMSNVKATALTGVNSAASAKTYKNLIIGGVVIVGLIFWFKKGKK